MGVPVSKYKKSYPVEDFPGSAKEILRQLQPGIELSLFIS
jgi:hypothetical protein